MKRKGLPRKHIKADSDTPMTVMPSEQFGTDQQVHAPTVAVPGEGGDPQNPVPEQSAVKPVESPVPPTPASDDILSAPLAYIVDPSDAIRKAGALMEKVAESVPGMAPAVEQVQVALDALEQKSLGGTGAEQVGEGTAPAEEFAPDDQVVAHMSEGEYNGVIVEKTGDTYTIRTDQNMTLKGVSPASISRREQAAPATPAPQEQAPMPAPTPSMPGASLKAGQPDYDFLEAGNQVTWNVPGEGPKEGTVEGWSPTGKVIVKVGDGTKEFDRDDLKLKAAAATALDSMPVATKLATAVGGATPTHIGEWRYSEKNDASSFSVVSENGNQVSLMVAVFEDGHVTMRPYIGKDDTNSIENMPGYNFDSPEDIEEMKDMVEWILTTVDKNAASWKEEGTDIESAKKRAVVVAALKDHPMAKPLTGAQIHTFECESCGKFVDNENPHFEGPCPECKGKMKPVLSVPKKIDPNEPKPPASSAHDVLASAFDQVPEIDLGSGYTASRVESAPEGDKDKEKKIEVKDKDGKVVETYPDAFGDDTVAIIKFLRQVLDIKDEPTKKDKPAGEKEPKEPKEDKGEKSSVSDKPRALPDAKPAEDEKALVAAAARNDAKVADCRHIAARLFELGQITAKQSYVEELQLTGSLVDGATRKTRKYTLLEAQVAAGKKAVNEKYLDLLAQPDDRLFLLKASLPLMAQLEVKASSVPADKLPPINLSAASVVIPGAEAKKFTVGDLFSGGFKRK